MVLVDTSIWIDHFNRKNDELEYLLVENQVVLHPYIIAEIACGNLRQRNLILSLLRAMPSVKILSMDEYFLFLEKNKLYGIGLGFVDVNIVGSSLLSNCQIYTRDKELNLAASKFNIKYK